MVTEQEVVERCQLIVNQTGKRPTVRAVLADGTIRGDRGKIAKIVSQFNKSYDKVPTSNFEMTSEVKEIWESALKTLTDTLIRVFKIQETKNKADNSEAFSAALDSADEAFAYAEQMEERVKELEASFASQNEELIALRASVRTQLEETEKRVYESADKAKEERERADKELFSYKMQSQQREKELQQSIKEQFEKINTLEAECAELSIQAKTAEAASDSKSAELNRLLQERERLEVLHRDERKELLNQIQTLQAEMQRLGAMTYKADAETKRADKAEARINELEKKYMEQVQLTAELRAKSDIPSRKTTAKKKEI